MSSNQLRYTTVVPSKSGMKKMGSMGKCTLVAVNPEVFSVSPRAGGYVKNLPSASRSNTSILQSSRMSVTKSFSETSMNVYYSTSRERRINLALTDSDWDLSLHDIEPDGAGSAADSMLAVTISCVMLLAAHAKKIPEEYLTYAERYLSCIKDERDFHPPNIQSILNYIQYYRFKKSKNKKDSASSLATSKDSKKSLKKKSSTKVKINESTPKKKSNIPVRQSGY